MLKRINSVGIPEMGIVLPELQFYPQRFPAILYFRYTVINRAAKRIKNRSRDESAWEADTVRHWAAHE